MFGHGNRDPKEDSGAGGMVTGGFTVMGEYSCDFESDIEVVEKAANIRHES